jgi:outer membrane protein assembly factor BamB
MTGARVAALCALIASLLVCVVGCGGGSTGGGGGTTSTISGTIVDAANPTQPISSAYVYVPASGLAARQSGGKVAEATSGPDGSYELTGVPEGIQTIVIQPPSGYAAFEITLKVAAGSEVSIRITVLPNASAATVRSIQIEPTGAVLAQGAHTTFHARVLDANFQELDLAPTWLADGDAGVISPAGVFTAAPRPGEGTVTATVGPVSGSASVRVTAGSTLSGGPADSAWPMFRHDVRRTGQSPYAGPDHGVLAWRYNAGDWVLSSPAIGEDGTVYVGSVANKLLAMHPGGTLAWEYAVDNVVDSSPAVAKSGTIFVGGGKGNLYALYAVSPTGAAVWDYDMNANPGRSSPLIGLDGMLYIGGMHLLVHAVEPDGTMRWQYRMGNWVQSSPALGLDGSILVSSWDDSLTAIRPNGTRLWAYEMGDDSYSTPAVGDNGVIYVGSNDDSLHAVNPNGTRRWVFPTGGDVRSSPAIAPNGNIIVGSGDGKVYCIYPNGTLRWAFDAGSRVDSSPAVDANGDVYVGAWDGTFYAIDATGTEKWRYATGNRIESSPAIAEDGTVYVGSHDDYLYAFREAP